MELQDTQWSDCKALASVLLRDSNFKVIFSSQHTESQLGTQTPRNQIKAPSSDLPGSFSADRRFSESCARLPKVNRLIAFDHNNLPTFHQPHTTVSFGATKFDYLKFILLSVSTSLTRLNSHLSISHPTIQNKSMNNSY